MATHNRYNILVIFFVALGSFTYGLNSAIVGSILGLDSFLDYFNFILTGPGSEKTNGLIGGMYNISCLNPEFILT